MCAAGIDIAFLQKSLGHSNRAMTEHIFEPPEQKKECCKPPKIEAYSTQGMPATGIELLVAAQILTERRFAVSPIFLNPVSNLLSKVNENDSNDI